MLMACVAKLMGMCFSRAYTKLRPLKYDGIGAGYWIKVCSYCLVDEMNISREGLEGIMGIFL
jgi:hypothetical protein